MRKLKYLILVGILFQVGVVVNMSLKAEVTFSESTNVTSKTNYEGAEIKTITGVSTNESGVTGNQVINFVETKAGYDNIQLVHWSYNHDYTWSKRNLSTLAADYEKRNPGYEIIAGVNGCFFNMSDPYYPFGDSVVNGKVMSKYMSWLNHNSHSLAVDINNNIISASSPYATFESGYTLYVYDETGSYIIDSFPININREIVEGGTSVFMYRGTNTTNESNVTYFNVGTDSPESGSEADERDFIKYPTSDPTYQFYFAEGLITSTGGGRTLKENQFTIGTKNQTLIDLVNVGKTKVYIQNDMTGAYQTAYNMGGTGGLVINNGNVRSVPTTENSTATGRHPRTAIAQKKDGSFILMTVDGRDSANGRDGVSATELGTILKNYGANNGFMMDGGGSTTLLVKNSDGTFKTINQLSDGSERLVADAWFLVVPKVNSNLKLNQIDDQNVEMTFNTKTNGVTLKEMNLIINGNKEKIDINTKKITRSLVSNTDNFICVEYVYEENGNENTLYSRTYLHNTKDNKKYIAPRDFSLTGNNITTGFRITMSCLGESSSISLAKLVINGNEYTFLKGVLTLAYDKLEVNKTTEVKLYYKYRDEELNQTITKTYNYTWKIYYNGTEAIILDEINSFESALVGSEYLNAVKNK